VSDFSNPTRAIPEKGGLGIAPTPVIIATVVVLPHLRLVRRQRGAVPAAARVARNRERVEESRRIAPVRKLCRIGGRHLRRQDGKNATTVTGPADCGLR
jgi:hypothetical protein